MMRLMARVDAVPAVALEDPPAARGLALGPGVWETRLLPLMEHEGRWVLVGEFVHGSATKLRNGKLRKPSGRWEFRSSKSRADGTKAGSGRMWLYARYLGAEGPIAEGRP